MPLTQDLRAWLEALHDLDLGFLEVPSLEEPRETARTRASVPRTRGEAPAPATPASQGPGPRSDSAPPREKTMPGPPSTQLPEPPPERQPLSGPFPGQLRVLQQPDLEALVETSPGAEGLEEIREILGPCTRCRLHEDRTHIVFGVGNPQAEVMFVGEGPGRDEDLKGEPFVGRAGGKLDQMIDSMGYERSQVYIANVVKCRPPKNRTPTEDEAETCAPFLHAQIAAVRPRVLIALGLPASRLLLGDCPSMKAVRGRFHEYRGVPVMPTYHPAYLLRSPGQNVKVAHDLALVLRVLGRELPSWAATALREGAP